MQDTDGKQVKEGLLDGLDSGRLNSEAFDQELLKKLGTTQ